MNKKQLYESIMKNVSIEVKKAINESANNEQFPFINPVNIKDILQDAEDRFEEMDSINEYGVVPESAISALFKIVANNVDRIHNETGFDWYEGHINGAPLDYAYDSFSELADDDELCAFIGNVVFKILASHALKLRNAAYKELEDE